MGCAPESYVDLQLDTAFVGQLAIVKETCAWAVDSGNSGFRAYLVTERARS